MFACGYSLSEPLISVCVPHLQVTCDVFTTEGSESASANR